MLHHITSRARTGYGEGPGRRNRDVRRAVGKGADPWSCLRISQWERRVDTAGWSGMIGVPGNPTRLAERKAARRGGLLSGAVRPGWRPVAPRDPLGSASRRHGCRVRGGSPGGQPPSARGARVCGVRGRSRLWVAGSCGAAGFTGVDLVPGSRVLNVRSPRSAWAFGHTRGSLLQQGAAHSFAHDSVESSPILAARWSVVNSPDRVTRLILPAVHILRWVASDTRSTIGAADRRPSALSKRISCENAASGPAS